VGEGETTATGDAQADRDADDEADRDVDDEADRDDRDTDDEADRDADDEADRDMDWDSDPDADRDTDRDGDAEAGNEVGEQDEVSATTRRTRPSRAEARAELLAGVLDRLMETATGQPRAPRREVVNRLLPKGEPPVTLEELNLAFTAWRVRRRGRRPS